MSTYKTDYIEFEGTVQRLTDVVERARYYVMRKDHHSRDLLLALKLFARNTQDTALDDEMTKLTEKLEIPTITASKASSQNPASSNNMPQQIDVNRLEHYFSWKFKDKGKGGDETSGFETLVYMLQNVSDNKKLAKIAYQIYQSKYFIKGEFDSFAPWYKTFCEIVGCNYVKSYKPSKLKLTEREEASFLFLK